MTKTTYLSAWIGAWILILAALALALSGCANLVQREDFDANGVRPEIFKLESEICDSEAAEYQKRFGWRNQYFVQCMLEKGYRIRKQ